MTTLDIEVVRAFVTVAHFHSFTVAALELGTTQAVISVKIKRLEDKLGFRLLDRTPRHVSLTPKGAVFLEGAMALLAAHEYALSSLAQAGPRLRLGMAAHVMGAEITSVLALLQQNYPHLQIELQVDSPKALLDAFYRKKLDVAVIRQEDALEKGQPIYQEPYAWFATSDFRHDTGKPLRIASLSPSCAVKNKAADALRQTEIPWEETFVGGSFVAMQAAVAAGLAIAVFPKRLAPAGTVDVGQRFSLPELPTSSIVLFSSLVGTTEKQMLKAMIHVLSRGLAAGAC